MTLKLSFKQVTCRYDEPFRIAARPFVQSDRLHPLGVSDERGENVMNRMPKEEYFSNHQQKHHVVGIR